MPETYIPTVGDILEKGHVTMEILEIKGDDAKCRYVRRFDDGRYTDSERWGYALSEIIASVEKSKPTITRR
jgi:hypothetical protein